jgi:predicted Zn-dependent protease
VERLGLQLAAASERPDLPWSFRVVDDPTPNAFAAPGGFIFITRGLLALIRNEAELVSVLGHEIGHVTARHSVAMMSRAQLAQIGLGLGAVLSPEMAARFGDLAAGGLQLLFLSHSREAERQADDLGFRYALEQGYDVREMVNVFASLQAAAALVGQTPVPSWMATHPYPGERIARINQRIAQLPTSEVALRIGEDEYLERITNLAYGPNPRNGYFEDNRYNHPDLAFRLDMPRGWRTQNTARAVIAGSPEQDAIIQLTLTEGTREEASATFFQQQGLSAGRIRTTEINGLAAVIGEFEAQRQDLRLGGLAAFITLQDRTYQFLAYTPLEQRLAYERTFDTAIRSFARLTDQAALERQPRRLSIVHVPRRMTVEQMNRDYPSLIPMAELVLINQVADAQALLPQGFAFKRVSE